MNEGKFVVKEWVKSLNWKQQTVLLTAIRGCDGIPKEDVSKKIVRKYRSIILNCAVPKDPKFMEDKVTDDDIYLFSKQPDQYNLHWYCHFMHACEIVGYKHPDKAISNFFNNLYRVMANTLHLNIETKDEMDIRLKDGKEVTCWKL